MNTDPAAAPPRADLSFLRRRSRPRTPTPAVPATGSTGGHIDYAHHERARDAPAAAATPSTGARPKIDFSRPDRRPATPPAAAPVAPRAAAPPAAGPPRTPSAAPPADALDLSAGPPAGALDLSSTPAPSSSAPASPALSSSTAPVAPRGPALRRHADRHVAGREQVLLTVKEPTVTLTRVQSGVGHLTIEAVCSPEVGDLRLGAVYQFRSGGTSTVQHAGGNRFAPSSRRPVIVAGREEYERLSVDLRQIRDIERISIYAFSESRTALTWGGTLVLDTFGGGRLELPLETLYSSTVAVLLSLYNLDGELVIRAEMESIVGDVREAARAYGYERIAWRNDRSPVD